MKAVHTGDWHLSVQRSRLDPETGINARLMDFYRCARFTVEDGVRRGAQLMLHAGDAFHSCRPSPTEVRLCRGALWPALEAGVPVVMIVGNHDAPRSPAENHALDLLRGMDGLHVVDRPALLNVWTGRGGTVVEPPEMATPDGRDLAFQIACLPYPNKQLLLRDEDQRKLEPGALNQMVREKMMDCAAGLRAQAIEGVPTILLGHFSVDLAEAGGQNRLMMLGGEWTLNLHELQAFDFDAILLGHIHKPQEWVDERGRATAYCGSPEAVSFGEEGEPKSYCLWEINPGEAPLVERVATPHRRFLTLEVGAPWPPAEELAGAIVRVRVPQAQEVDTAELRRDLDAAGVHEYQIETQRAETVRRRAVEVSAETALDEALRAYLDQRPDLHPLTDALITEALRVEDALRAAEGGAA